MPHWDDGTRWDSGARWAPEVPQKGNKNKMAIIVTNTSRLPITDKLVKGQDIITKSTNNPAVPGNGAALTTFSNAQADLQAANADYEASRQNCMQKQAARENALAGWNTALNGLAGVTENATQGDAEKILSAGFDVRAPRTPKPPLGAPTDVLAQTNGAPGVTKLNWSPMDGARLYVIQQNPNPTQENGWVQAATSTKSRCETDGVQPGTEMWYRVAGVDGDGQGPWSAPTCRPVM
jgi:hypothetical protein